MMSIIASASGDVAYVASLSSPSNVNYSYSSVSTGEGKKSATAFKVTSNSQGVRLSTSSSSGAKIQFKYGNDYTYSTITIPKQTAGVPSTIYTTASLSTSYQYQPQVIADSGTVSGYFDISSAKKA